MSISLLKMEQITKRFPGVLALDTVDFDLQSGEVHGILGENGAGKSTLMNILGGIYHPDSGKIFCNGEEVQINGVLDAQHYGIAFIHQELALEQYMTVAENIFLGRELQNRARLVSKSKMERESGIYLSQVGLDIEPSMKVSKLSPAQRQMVEIAKALSLNARIIVMDEPTSSLSENEVKTLFKTIRALKERGVGIIYISHKMDEFFEISDRITVMRDGKTIGTKTMAETDQNDLIKMMIGRELKNYYVRTYHEIGDVIFEVRNLCRDDFPLHNVSFQVHKGEIFGLYGLVGAGRSELMRSVFGIDPMTSGEIHVEGKRIKKLNPHINQENGMVMVPENRKSEGLIINDSVGFNLTITVLESFMHMVSVNQKKENEIIGSSIRRLSIKTPSPRQSVKKLSGGNQQKVVIAKWLAAEPKILIMDEPTRGVDVGAKAEIYKIINQLSENGITIIIVSSELPEIINMCDRIAIMSKGSITGIIDRKEFSQESIMHYAMGGI